MWILLLSIFTNEETKALCKTRSGTCPRSHFVLWTVTHYTVYTYDTAYLLNWMEMLSFPKARALLYQHIVIKMLSNYFSNYFWTIHYLGLIIILIIISSTSKTHHSFQTWCWVLQRFISHDLYSTPNKLDATNVTLLFPHRWRSGASELSNFWS